MASQHTSPSPLLLTHTLHATDSTYNWQGAYGWWTAGHVHSGNTAADGCMSVVKLTTFDMQLNTQRFIENKMLIKKQGMLN